MPRPLSEHPTPVEAEILKVVWEKGPVSVRDVHDVVGAARDSAYSSVATIMRIMVKKGYLKISDKRRPVRFVAEIERDVTARAMVKDLVDRLFGGSVSELLRHALPAKKRSKQSVAELRDLLNELD